MRRRDVATPGVRGGTPARFSFLKKIFRQPPKKGFLSVVVATIKRMFGKVKQAVGLLEKAVGALDPDTLDPSFALDLVRLFSKAEKLSGAGKALAASRVASSGSWRTKGDRSAAHFISRTTGDSIGASVTAIETARRLAELPSSAEAFRSGVLTQAQAAEIASAASVAPEAEKQLLRVAKTEGIAGLKQMCQKVVAQACSDEAKRAERLHRERYLRSWTDSEGAFRLDARLAPEAGAEVRATLDALRDLQFQQARRQGRKEPYQALDADALLEMARAARAGGKQALGPKALVNVRVDHAALVRGHAGPGEVCEVPGVGPIPVAAARELMSDSILKLLVSNGKEVQAVAHEGRTIPARLRTALTELYPECAISGCRESKRLEIDHVLPRAEGGATSLDNLVRICSHHHRLKTYRGFALARVKGKWRLDPPSEKGARASP